MKKKLLSRICCLALVAVVALGCCTSAFAAQNSMSNFSRVKTYSNQYSDVSSTDWSYGAIKTCYETSLMNGYDDGSFGRRDYLTVAQALVMADRVHQIYTTGANSLTNGTPWYQPYIDYAIEKGIIKAGDFSSYTDYITRADMAYIFSRALPTKELGKLNDIGEIPDVNDAPQRDRDPAATSTAPSIPTTRSSARRLPPSFPASQSRRSADRSLCSTRLRRALLPSVSRRTAF